MNTETTNDTTSTTPATTEAPAKAKPARKAKSAKPSVKKAATKAEKKAKSKKGKKPVAAGDLKGPAVLKKYAPGYVHDKDHKTASGNPSVHCGDDVAKKFLGKDLDAIYTMVAKATETPEADLRKKYKGLNLGMQRMNLGNRMRGVLNAK
jgi:hypothetical protein